MASSKEVTDFTNAWVMDNIEVGPYDPGEQIISQHVAEFLESAKQSGISKEDLEENVGDISDFISDAFEQATDDEVERLASKDD